MSIKLKALGLGLLAALALSVIAVVNASATGPGHFTSGSDPHVIVRSEQIGEYTGKFINGNEIHCNAVTAEGTTPLSTTTVTSLTLVPVFSGCTIAATGSLIEYTVNGCTYEVTIETHATTTKNKVHLRCPAGKQIESHWSLGFFGKCTVTTAPQTPGGGITFHTGGSGATHDLTATVTVTGLKVEYHQTGIGCGKESATTISETGELKANATVKSINTAGVQVGITATGSTGGEGG